jgi:hypothetical protein
MAVTAEDVNRIPRPPSPPTAGKGKCTITEVEKWISIMCRGWRIDVADAGEGPEHDQQRHLAPDCGAC